MNFDGWLEKTQQTHLSLTDSTKSVNTELLLKEFQLHVDLVKHYLDLIIKFNVFYYAVTGGLLSYYFANSKTERLVKLSLLLPILMSIFFGLLFIGASRAIPQVDEQITYISTLLGFAKPEVRVLRFALIASGFLFVSIGIGLAYLFIAGTEH